MADFFNKVKNTINKTTKEIGVKSSTMMETNKLKSDISALKKEKTDNFTAIGTKIYEMKVAGGIDLGQISDLLAKVDELDASISAKEQAIDEAQKKKEEELNAISQGMVEITCTCGAVVLSSTKFCSKCGKNIEELKVELAAKAAAEAEAKEQAESAVEEPVSEEAPCCDCEGEVQEDGCCCDDNNSN